MWFVCIHVPKHLEEVTYLIALLQPTGLRKPEKQRIKLKQPNRFMAFLYWAFTSVCFCTFTIPVASFPGSCAGEEEREPGTYTLFAHAPSSLGNLHTTLLY